MATVCLAGCCAAKQTGKLSYILPLSSLCLPLELGTASPLFYSVFGVESGCKTSPTRHHGSRTRQVSHMSYLCACSFSRVSLHCAHGNIFFRLLKIYWMWHDTSWTTKETHPMYVQTSAKEWAGESREGVKDHYHDLYVPVIAVENRDLNSYGRSSSTRL